MIYIVTMYRFGHRQGHSYVLVVTQNKDTAIAHANSEEHDRGGKYAAEIVGYKLDDPENWQVIKKLDSFYKDKTNAICNSCGQVIKEKE